VRLGGEYEVICSDREASDLFGEPAGLGTTLTAYRLWRLLKTGPITLLSNSRLQRSPQTHFRCPLKWGLTSRRIDSAGFPESL
jgi:hypothetical protein